MSVLFQISLGSAILLLCTLIQIVMILWLVTKVRDGQAHTPHPGARRTFTVMSGIVLVLLFAHTLHLYIWALSLWLVGALPGYEEPIYFALVTYTTVGYGDVTLDKGFRILGAMASVNGILSFGLTTAFMVGLIPRIFVALRE